MPRPNRYHPYNGHRQQTAPPVPSPRYPPPPTLSHPHPMPAISEQSTGKPFQYIHSNYIRGFTQDGKTLLTRSIIQSSDGVFHITMEPVRFPSQCIGQTSVQSGMPVDPRLAANRWTSHGVTSTNHVEDVRLSIERPGRLHDARSDSGKSQSHDDECAVISEDDEDAIGEEDEQYHLQAVMEQRKIILGLMHERRISAQGNNMA